MKEQKTFMLEVTAEEVPVLIQALKAQFEKNSEELTEYIRYCEVAVFDVTKEGAKELLIEGRHVAELLGKAYELR